jgi:hypothetical protein
MDVTCSSELSVEFQQTTQCYIQGDRNLQIHNRWQIVSVAFPVNLAEGRLVIQADRWPCDSANICKISVSCRKSKVAQQAYEGHMVGCDKARI